MEAEQWLKLPGETGSTYWLTRFCILRLLGVIYAVAFLVAANQLVPLIGEHGLLPLPLFIDRVRDALGSSLDAVLAVAIRFLDQSFRYRASRCLLDWIRVVVCGRGRICERDSAWPALVSLHVDRAHRSALVFVRLGSAAPRNGHFLPFLFVRCLIRGHFHAALHHSLSSGCFDF